MAPFKKPAAVAAVAPSPKGIMKRPADGQPLPKGPAWKKAKSEASDEGGLTDEKLQELKQMTLREKVAAVAAEHPEDEAAAQETLEKVITPKEKQSAWQQHQTHLKNNPLQKGEHEALSKKEKGAAVLTWLLQKSPTFAVERHSRSRDNTFEKRGRWLSQLEADRKWSEQEQQLLIASGRVLWREDPMTPGVYEYKDTQDFRGSSKVRDRSSWERVREEELPEEKGWEEALGKDLSTFLRSSTPLQKGLGKGAASSSTGDRFLGKGKCKPSAKAKAKGHNKGHLTIENLDPALAIQDRSSAELQAEALGKARKMRDLQQQTISNLEEAIDKAKNSKWVSPNHVTEAKGIVASLHEDLKKCKAVLADGSVDVSSLKKDMLGWAAQVKEGKDTVKELASLAGKTSSRVGTD